MHAAVHSYAQALNTDRRPWTPPRVGRRRTTHRAGLGFKIGAVQAYTAPWGDRASGLHTPQKGRFIDGDGPRLKACAL